MFGIEREQIIVTCYRWVAENPLKSPRQPDCPTAVSFTIWLSASVYLLFILLNYINYRLWQAPAPNTPSKMKMWVSKLMSHTTGQKPPVLTLQMMQERQQQQLQLLQQQQLLQPKPSTKDLQPNLESIRSNQRNSMLPMHTLNRKKDELEIISKPNRHSMLPLSPTINRQKQESDKPNTEQQPKRISMLPMPTQKLDDTLERDKRLSMSQLTKPKLLNRIGQNSGVLTKPLRKPVIGGEKAVEVSSATNVGNQNLTVPVQKLSILPNQVVQPEPTSKPVVQNAVMPPMSQIQKSPKSSNQLLNAQQPLSNRPKSQLINAQQQPRPLNQRPVSQMPPMIRPMYQQSQIQNQPRQMMPIPQQLMARPMMQLPQHLSQQTRPVNPMQQQQSRPLLQQIRPIKTNIQSKQILPNGCMSPRPNIPLPIPPQSPSTTIPSQNSPSNPSPLASTPTNAIEYPPKIIDQIPTIKVNIIESPVILDEIEQHSSLQQIILEPLDSSALEGSEKSRNLDGLGILDISDTESQPTLNRNNL